MKKILTRLLKDNIKHKNEVNAKITEKQKEFKENWNKWGTKQKIQKD